MDALLAVVSTGICVGFLWWSGSSEHPRFLAFSAGMNAVNAINIILRSFVVKE